MLLGVFVNMILYGVFLTQSLEYFKTHLEDGKLRYFVAYLFALESLNTGFAMVIMYQPLILKYGEPLTYFPTFFLTEPLLIVLISTPIQFFFAWRIRTITKLTSVPLVICVLSLASLAGGLWTSAKIGIIREFAKKPLLHAPALVWFLSAASSDVIITISLVLTLSNRKTGFAATDTVIDKIIRSTIQTGLVTAVFSVLDVVFFMVFPHYALNFIWDLALSKLYSNALLSTLNARVRLGAISTSQPLTGGGGRSPQSPRGPAGPGATSHIMVFEDMAGLVSGSAETGKYELGEATDLEMGDMEGEENAYAGSITKDDAEVIVETPRDEGGFAIPLPVLERAPLPPPPPQTPLPTTQPQP
uniref:DUF6534 domain-containing protein n=1 Tax=Mycena chlorophos TaxID=658473 RepID=A0ABQ0L978_MYCCL|nr:predicted protein [Mycena chlorophos]